MIYRRVVWALGAVAMGIIVPVQAHAQPPTQCLTNTLKGKQVYIPCDLLKARVNYPPGQRCVGDRSSIIHWKEFAKPHW